MLIILKKDNPMKLKDWIEKSNYKHKKMSAYRFAKLVGLETPSNIYGWINESKKPSAKFLKRISEITNDEVTINDF
jgi:hypothetical protein